MKRQELKPNRVNQKSFYGKAYTITDNHGNVTLYSYDTRIMTRKTDGNYVRHWDDWSMTTGKHIREFSGMNKAEYSKLEIVR